MKKFIIIFVSTLVIATIVLALLFRFYAPVFVADVITSDEEPPAILPAKVREQIVSVREAVDEGFEDVPEELQKLGLTFDDVIRMVDLIDPDQVTAAIEELQNTPLTSTDQAFDILVRHVKIEGYDLNAFRSLVTENLSVEKIDRELGKVDVDDFLASMSLPVIRETVKQILIEKRDEVEANLPR